MSRPEFSPFPKMARWSREIIITEKIDGTNACIYIGEDGEFLTASRTRWITPEADNYGFSRWAHENREDLLRLGPGQHFGEWWGAGIQRRYDMAGKRFSLFNVSRWEDDDVRPACCHITPIIYRGPMFDGAIGQALAQLGGCSLAAPGFTDPEGVVLFHVAAGIGFKKTIKKDEQPKGASA